jgi:hypothetical protein
MIVYALKPSLTGPRSGISNQALFSVIYATGFAIPPGGAPYSIFKISRYLFVYVTNDYDTEEC